ncbi:hypothetical protein B4U37_03100 [Sutcliffiella horikoshii]|uniref:DUF1146 domain-containing protein n=1 Tax=Sutcliffiella horikoshii TaxID=79883 RepID=A0ABM6KF07_9BACI|nr:hypothetical protein B4U37_03100 [Sutcliffiella horikoshii]
MYYESITSALYTIIFWWLIFLIFQRINNRYPERNSWKKDITITFFQSVIISLLVAPIAFLLIK